MLAKSTSAVLQNDSLLGVVPVIYYPTDLLPYLGDVTKKGKGFLVDGPVAQRRSPNQNDLIARLHVLGHEPVTNIWYGDS